jgi:general secretion pathway protein D
VAQAAETVTEIFEIYHRDPKELVPLLQVLLDKGIQSKPAGGAPKAPPPGPVASSRSKSKDGKPIPTGAATSVAVGSGPRALTILAESRYNWIIAKGSVEDVNEVRTWIEKLDKAVPTIMAEDSLEGIANKNQIVQRFIKLQKCSPSQMAEIIRPLMGQAGYVTADEDARNLLLIDTVENLLRIEPVIARFDADQTDGSVVEVFEIRHREPEEIIQLLETLFGGGQSGNSGSRNWSSQPSWPSSKDSSSRHGQSRPRAASRDGSATSVVIGVTGRAMALVPVPRNKWIIARASPEDIQQIGQWVHRLDASFPTVLAGDSLADMQNKNQVVQRFIELQNYSPARMAEIVGPLMGESGYVSGDEATGSLLVIDTVENLLRIEPVIAHFGVAESEHTEAKVFEIHHRQPDEIIRLLDTLLGDGASLTGAGRNGASRSSRSSAKSSSWQTGQSGSTPRSRDAGAPAAIVGASGRLIVLISDPEQKLIIAKASPEDISQIDQWIQRLDRAVPTLVSDEPLTDIEDKNQIVQKCIKLQSFSPGRMADIVLPLLSESGFVSADEMTGNLLLIDTVQNLLQIEMVIAQFDVPEAEGTVTEILEVLHSDPSEIIQLVRMLLGDGNTRSMSAYSASGRYGTSSRRPYTGSNLYRGGSGSSGSNSMLVGPSQMPVVLIPESKRKWIIARASAQDMTSIREWVTRLDREEQLQREYETISITYADPREVATQLNQALQQMPGTELEASVLVQPLDQAKQIVVFGRSDLREMVKKLIEEIDIPPGQFLTEHFRLNYADPDVIERNVNDLYGESRLMSSRRLPGQTGTSVSPDTVKVISHLALKEVTVIASPSNMDKIRQQIGEWDVAIDVNEVKPRIIELHNSDTVQMRDLLTTLFSREAAGNRFSVYDYLFGFGHQDKEKIIGPLYGQLTFEEVPGTKKIIVISNIPGAYDIVEDLVRRLDQQEMAEVPKVIKLQYRNPETLAESLNAMFNETGTSASVRLSEQGLSDYSMDDSQGTTNTNGSRNTAGASSAARGPAPGPEYRPWWTTGRNTLGEMPISNVIGRARFIPDRYSSSILALAPPEFMENIEQMIHELDIPGKQVMIKAIIIQIDHSNMTSLGMQLSSDQTRWSTLDNENAVTARNVLSLLEKHGALVFGAGGDAGSRTEVTVSTDVTVLIDFLIKELNAKILNQQTLWTKDNEEAEFFKGQRVGFQTRVSISDTGGRATSDYEYEKVGMTLRTRPSITPEKNVDMIINVVLSQLTPEEINNQRVRTEMDTTTNMIVQDGQTLMLGGMLFNEDSNVQRKLPLLGDLPLVGGLFRHNEGVIANSELLIFVTPYVVDGLEETLPETLKEIEQPKSRLRNVQEQLQKTRTENASSTSEAAGEENEQ